MQMNFGRTGSSGFSSFRAFFRASVQEFTDVRPESATYNTERKVIKMNSLMRPLSNSHVLWLLKVKHRASAFTIIMLNKDGKMDCLTMVTEEHRHNQNYDFQTWLLFDVKENIGKSNHGSPI